MRSVKAGFVGKRFLPQLQFLAASTNDISECLLERIHSFAREEKGCDL